MKKFFLPLLVLFFLLAILSLVFLLRPQSVLNTPVNIATKSTQINLKPVKDFSRLNLAVNQVLAESQASFAVTYVDLNSREKLSINGEKSFHAASTTKPIVAAYALKQVEEGEVGLDEQILGITLAERLRLMINISDNNSWETLLNFFGLSKIQEFSQSLGLSNTNHIKNTSTTDDLAKFLIEIFDRKVLSDKNRQFLLKYMQNTEREDGIPVGVSNKKLVFHKAGTYQGEVHDIAIVAHPKNPFVLAILSVGENDLDSRPAILAEIAQVSWKFAEGKL